jgi:hypothetical protein
LANPTTNYGFVLPTPTDLVTDLPADFDVALQGVDTRIKALNPSTTLGDTDYGSAVANVNTRLPIGTTGQILSVVAGVPAWVANDVGDITAVTAGTGISGGGASGDVTVTNSMATAIDAKGDLVPGTGADAFARLAVGANNTVLTADSTAATGMKWAAAAAGSGMVHLKTATFSGVADTGASFDSLFTSAYDNYLVVWNCSGTPSSNLQIQFRYAGPTTQVLTYLWLLNDIEGAGPTSTLSRNVSDTQIRVTKYLGTSAYASKGVMQLNGVLSAGSRPSYNWQAFVPEYDYWALGGGFQSTSRVYTGLLLKASAGNISGTVSVYGLVNA